MIVTTGIERVPKNVAADHHPVVQPFGDRRSDVVLPQHLQHRRACHPHDDGDQEDGKETGREEHLLQVGQRILGGRYVDQGRGPAELERRDQDQDRRQPEVRHR